MHHLHWLFGIFIFANFLCILQCFQLQPRLLLRGQSASISISGIDLSRRQSIVLSSTGKEETTSKEGFKFGLIPKRKNISLKTVFFFLTPWIFSNSPVFAKGGKIHGWDLFGRVPYDDFLFTTRKLLDPNLFRQSMVEAVMNEIPTAYSSFQRRMIFADIFKGAKNAVLLALISASIFLIFKFRPTQVDKWKERFSKLRGFDTPLSAKLKDKNKKRRK